MIHFSENDLLINESSFLSIFCLEQFAITAFYRGALPLQKKRKLFKSLRSRETFVHVDYD